MQNEQPVAARGQLFMHQNGKTYRVEEPHRWKNSAEGCVPDFSKFGVYEIRNGKSFGPIRSMRVANVAKWL